jgi:hypothetical protein
MAIVLGPWLALHQRHRGSYRLSGGSSVHLWTGLARAGLLDPDYPLPSDVAREYAPYAGRKLNDAEFWAFLDRVDGLGDREELLGDWARASVRSNLAGYLRAVAYAACWQMNVYPEGGATTHDELNWFVRRATEERNNFCFDRAPGAGERYEMYGTGGPLPDLLGGVIEHRWQGVPQVVLAGLAGLTVILGAIRRQWAVALVLSGTLAFVMAHALLLFPNSRYALPVWMVWYACVATVPAWVLGWRHDRQERHVRAREVASTTA